MQENDFNKFEHEPGFATQVIELIGEGLAISDENDIIVYANPTLLKLTGYSFEEISGLPSRELVFEDHQEKVSRALDERKKEGKSIYEVHLKRKSGDLIPVRITSVMRQEAGQFAGSIAIVHDLTARRRAESDLNLFKSVVINSRDAYLIFKKNKSDELIPVYANKPFEEMANIRFSEIRGTESNFLGGLGVKQEVLKAFGEALTREDSYQGKGLISKRDGSKFWGDITCIPIQHPAVHGSYFATSIRDITKTKKREAELSQAIGRAEEAGREKEKLLSSMSHEIRTPLSGVLGMAQLLSKTDLDPEQQEYLDSIELSARNLTHVLNDILMFLDLEELNIELNERPFHLRESILKLNRTFKNRREKKSLDFNVEVGDSLPDMVYGDKDRYIQILMQLLVNAFKFTEQGEVAFRVEGKRREDGGYDVKCVITDTGEGISEYVKDSMFQSFTKETRGVMDSKGGIGIGLTIVKRLVDLMKGEIQIESELGKGTVCKVTIPFKPAGEMEPAETPDSSKQPGRSGKLNDVHILVVDDHPINLKLAEGMLNKANAKVYTATNGEDALKVIQNNPVELILMDVQMPGMNGLEVTRIIRSELQPPKSEIPVIAITASARQTDIEMCSNAGMNEFISKPFDIDNLMERIEMLLESERPHERRIEFRIKETVNKSSPVNYSVLKEMAAGDEEMMLELMELFLEQTPQLIQKLKECFETEDWEELGRTAHTLKPTFNYMGMNESYELAVELESCKDRPVMETADIEKKLNRLYTLVSAAYEDINRSASALNSGLTK